MIQAIYKVKVICYLLPKGLVYKILKSLLSKYLNSFILVTGLKFY